MIQFDDYGFWEGARRAVDEFSAERGITPTLTKLDYSGRQYVKVRPELSYSVLSRLCSLPKAYGPCRDRTCDRRIMSPLL